MDGTITKLDYVENLCRRTNILNDEIADEKENWDSENKVWQMLSGNLGPNGVNMDS